MSTAREELYELADESTAQEPQDEKPSVKQEVQEAIHDYAQQQPFHGVKEQPHRIKHNETAVSSASGRNPGMHQSKPSKHKRHGPNQRPSTYPGGLQPQHDRQSTQA